MSLCLARFRVKLPAAVIAALLLANFAVSAASASEARPQSSGAALAVSALVSVNGSLAPPGTTVDVLANGVTCATGVTQARNLPYATGSTLTIDLQPGAASTAGGCGTTTSYTFRSGGSASSQVAVDASRRIGGLIMIGDPVAVIEGTVSQSGAPQIAPDVRLVVGDGANEVVCASAHVVPPLPNNTAGSPSTFIELVVNPKAGCVGFGTPARIFVGDTEAATVTLQAGLSSVSLSVTRVVNSVNEGAPGSPAPSASLPNTGQPGDRGTSSGWRTARNGSAVLLGLLVLGVLLACWRRVRRRA